VSLPKQLAKEEAGNRNVLRGEPCQVRNRDFVWLALPDNLG
jgi:hypothetical protein